MNEAQHPPRFDGLRLQIAREAKGITRHELAELINASPSFISACEKGTKRPSPDLQILLCANLRVRPSFFFDSSAADWSIESCHYRHRQVASKFEKGRLRSEAHIYTRVIEGLSRFVHFLPVKLPLASLDQPANQVAQAVRNLWGLKADTPIASLCTLIENAGVVVMYHSTTTDRIDACSRRSEIPLILLASDGRSASRLRFDLGHELAELVFSSGNGGTVEHERMMNAFVGHFMMPSKGFGPHFSQKRLTVSHLFDLKKVWRVSMAAILQQALILELLSQEEYVLWKRKLASRGWSRSEPGETTQPPRPRSFQNAVSVAANAGLSLEALSEHAGISSDYLSELLKLNRSIIPQVISTEQPRTDILKWSSGISVVAS